MSGAVGSARISLRRYTGTGDGGEVGRGGSSSICSCNRRLEVELEDS